ncbi:MAG: DUF2281 domain-containing protein [Bacteroidales bacterium]|jgi:hypothetical protein|nr:DUF2281 domain-containing protein [Bacteroidales bacterium]
MNTTTSQYSDIEYRVFETMKKLQEPELKNEIWDFVQFIVQKKAHTTAIGERKPIFGIAKGKIKMAADFDEPLEEFKEYM